MIIEHDDFTWEEERIPDVNEMPEDLYPDSVINLKDFAVFAESWFYTVSRTKHL
jgi:hypothetical protein